MALTKEKKAEIVSEVNELLDSSKLTVAAKYSGTSVRAMQDLRKQAGENGTTIKVVKNRLFKQAVSGSDKFSNLDLSDFNGQLIYAFNDSDEVAPAQVLANFAKEQPQIEFVAGLSGDGLLLEASDVKALASLPSKDQLRGQLVGLIASPLSGFTQVLNGNLRGVLNVLDAKAQK